MLSVYVDRFYEKLLLRIEIIGGRVCINKGIQFRFLPSLIKLPYVSIPKFWFVYSQNVSYGEYRYSFFFTLKNDIMYNEILEI